MSPRALRLADALGGQLAELGRGVRSVSVESMLSWRFVRVACTDIDAMRALAVDLELDQARLAWRGERWRRAAPMQGGGVLVVTAGVHRGDGNP